MVASGLGNWRDMASAPRDGTRVLAQVRATEQGPAELDMVEWSKARDDGEERWISVDSDLAIPVFYADAELVSWMPAPATLPKLRQSSGEAGRTFSLGKTQADEGSGI